MINRDDYEKKEKEEKKEEEGREEGVFPFEKRIFTLDESCKYR